MKRTHLVRMLVAGLVALSLCAGVFAGPAAGQTGTPTVTNVTVTTGSNATVATTRTTTATDERAVRVVVEGENVTEVDITGVPADWTVRNHSDDFGSYTDQVDEQGRVVWLWSAPVSVTVSATFALPESPSPVTLSVVPYAGTTAGQSRNVSAATLGLTTPTAAAPSVTTADGTETESTDSDASEPDAETDDRTTTDSGPGFGVVTVLAALAVLAATRRLRGG